MDPPARHAADKRHRRSVSQSLAAWGTQGGRRVSVWMDHLAHPKSATTPPAAATTPRRAGTNLDAPETPRPRFSLSPHLSFSTPTLPFDPLPPSPPPSPPESVSSAGGGAFPGVGYPHALPTPPDSQRSSTSDLRRSHSRARSLSNTLGESLGLLGRRRRTTLAASSPPEELNISPPTPPAATATTATTTTTTTTTKAAVSTPLLLPELSFSASPLVALLSPRKQPRRSVVVHQTQLQPSLNESREFTKANTLQVQKRLAEVEAARVQTTLLSFDDLTDRLAVPDRSRFTVAEGRSARMEGRRVGEKGEEYTSVDVILSSYEASGEEAARRMRRRTAVDLSKLQGQCGERPPVVPVKDEGYVRSDGCVRWDGAAPVLAARGGLDIETAFSSLGGFGSGGIWRKIGVLLEPWDLARLARVSKRIKRIIEPLLYASITLAPNQPHGFSYSYLSRLLLSLHTPSNRSKLSKWTKTLTISAGWEENAITLLDNTTFLMDPSLPGITPPQMSALLAEEGPIGDGGINEINTLLSDLLPRLPLLQTFTCLSPLPLRSHLLSSLSVTRIQHLTLNLSQPMRLARCPRGTLNTHWSPIPKYRPCISALHTLPLQSLTLTNLPTRGGEWWREVWALIAANIATLRRLRLVMPHITRERYRDLFDRFHRIYHVPDHDEDERHLKTPPVFSFKAFDAARRARGCAGVGMRLEEVELTGFVVDERVFEAVVPGVLKRVVLRGCVEKAGFGFGRECWRGVEVFRSSGLGFVERVVESMHLGVGVRKELAFLSEEEDAEEGALEVLRRGVVRGMEVWGAGVEKLVLKEQWMLGAREVGSVLVPGLEEVALAVENSEDAWRALVEGVVRCRGLRKVHVLNGFSMLPGCSRGIVAGGGRRYVVDDAMLIGEAIISAAEAGSGADVDGVVVAVSRAAWKIKRVGGRLGMVRIPGALEQVIVGSPDGSL